MAETAGLQELLTQVLTSGEAATTLYAICERALEMTGSRNAMIAQFNNDLGYMTLRAGVGRDWRPSMLGERISVADDEREGITAYVAATGKSFLSGDVSAERRYKLLIPGTRSELACPIRDRDARVRAVLNVEADEAGKFGRAEQEKLELLALIAGLALDQQDARVREDALVQVGAALDLAQTEEQLLKRVAEVTETVLNVSAYSIFLWDESAQAFTLRDTVGSSTLAKEARYLPGEGCTGWVCRHGEPIRLTAPAEDPRWRGRYLEFPLEEIAAFIAVPVLSGKRCMGCMRALRKKPVNPYIDNRFTESEERVLMAIAEQLGAGLEKIRSVKKLVSSERMAAWGELSAKSAHMLGNRVFALKGDLNELRHLLSDERPVNAPLSEVLERLESGVARLDEILQDFRGFVNATRIEVCEADLNEVVKKAAGALVPASSKVKILFDLEPDLPAFCFDVEKIERVISELIENALHFVESGKVEVRTRRADQADLLEAGWTPRAGEYARIEVEDKGPGISEDLKTRIFYPYQSSRAKGMGLGLSIVKGIVDAHDGTVFEAGEQGKGARFVVLLPMTPKKPSA